MQKLALLPYLLFLALLTACVETDMSVPGFPEMMTYFSATEAQIQLTISINFLGFCVASLLFGPLSDSYGRRPIMLLGNAIFLLAALGTTTATTLPVLILWRFFQGIGASASFTLFVTMIADAYQGERASKLTTRLNGMMTAAMAGAPMMGGFLVESFGWRSTYSSVAALCLLSMVASIFFLPETNQERRPFVLKDILRSFQKVSVSMDFLTLSLLPTLSCAGYMAFVAGAVFFYVDVLKVPLTVFTLHQGAVIACFSLVSFFGGQINARIGARTAVISGVGASLLGALWLTSSAWLELTNPYIYTFGMCLFATGVALDYGATFTASMEVFPDMRGTASSVGIALRLVIISIAIWAVGLFYDGTFLPTAALILASAIGSALLAIPTVMLPRLSKLLA